MKKIVSSIAVFAMFSFAFVASAATNVITPSDMQGWVFGQETPTGSGNIVAGPVAGLGDGSANLVVDGTGGEILAKAYPGTALSNFTTLEYSTYRTSGGPALAVALQFNFDGNILDLNNSWQGRLVYEPYHTQTVSTGVWENWDAMDDAAGFGTGNWWFSNGTHATNSGCAMATPCTWSEVLAAFPNGGVHNTFGAVNLKAGGGWFGGFNGNVDALTIGVSSVDTTYDFELDPVDTDTDGVLDGDDKCPGTVADNFPQWGKSKGRWMLNSSDVWVYNGKPGTQGGFAPTIEDTYGCSGDQILDAMVLATGLDFGGHYKYGVTKSIIEDWIAGEYHVGPTLVETVVVPADDADGVYSVGTLEVGTDYFLRASGTAYACNEAGCVIRFDADYSDSNGDATWEDGVATPYDVYGTELLDLMVDGGFVNWGTYTGTHMYEIPYAGTGSTLALQVSDLYYPNNSGSLSVDIIEDVWVNLW